MRTFILTSTAFEGEVLFEFNDNGALQKNDLTGAILSLKQQEFLLQNLPLKIYNLEELIKKSNAAKLTELFVTFDMFWNKYNDKINSSKKKAKVLWDKKNKSQQNKAYYYINNYFASIPSGVRKKYAETYLGSELWNN